MELFVREREGGGQTPRRTGEEEGSLRDISMPVRDANAGTPISRVTDKGHRETVILGSFII